MAANEGFDADALASAIEAELRTEANPRRGAGQKADYRNAVEECIGCGVPHTRRTARRFHAAHRWLAHDQVTALVEALWGPSILERRACAIELLMLYATVLRPADAALIERMLRESGTWALVDGLAPGVMGRLVERYPELLNLLDRWAQDPDFWLRRAALLALLPSLRRGEGEFERFARYADAMLEEREFFIRKAIGWVLRETGKRRPEQVFAWLAPRTDRAAGVTVREAIKYLPAERAEALLEAYLERRALV